MIAICGALHGTPRGRSPALAIAERAGQAGASVQVVGIVPDGPEGDAELLGLAASGVGHAAVLRTGARPMEHADIELALRYLPDVHVVVATDLQADALTAVSDGAAYAGATLVIVTSASATGPDQVGMPESAIVLQAPAVDPEGTFAGFVAALAVRLDAGDVPADAWDATVRALAVDAISRGPGDRSPAAAR